MTQDLQIHLWDIFNSLLANNTGITCGPKLLDKGRVASLIIFRRSTYFSEDRSELWKIIKKGHTRMHRNSMSAGNRTKLKELGNIIPIHKCFNWWLLRMRHRRSLTEILPQVVDLTCPGSWEAYLSFMLMGMSEAGANICHPSCGGIAPLYKTTPKKLEQESAGTIGWVQHRGSG